MQRWLDGSHSAENQWYRRWHDALHPHTQWYTYLSRLHDIEQNLR
jgi:hypothetical protein